MEGNTSERRTFDVNLTALCAVEICGDEAVRCKRVVLKICALLHLLRMEIL
jgi:hypothetical protein